MGLKDSGSPSNPSADYMAKISRDLYNQTNPLRQAFIDRSMAFLGIAPQSQPQPSASPGSVRDMYPNMPSWVNPGEIEMLRSGEGFTAPAEWFEKREVPAYSPATTATPAPS